MDKISIIYKDKNFLALYKPAGILVHKVKTTKLPITNYQLPTLVDWLLKHFPEVKRVGDDPKTRPGIVHRLDKDTSGIILIARNQDYFEYLKKLFQTHQIKKTYLALVYGNLLPKSGEIKKPIFLKSGTTKRTVFKGKMEKEAITEYKVLKYFLDPRKSAPDPHKSATFSLLKAWPKTGRTHQIRIHLSSIGHPVVGDTLYGPKNNLLGLHRQFLHAESLEFSTSEGKKIKLEAELPKELADSLKKLTKLNI